MKTNIPYKALWGSLGSSDNGQVSRMYADSNGAPTIDNDGTSYTIDVLGPQVRMIPSRENNWLNTLAHKADWC